MTHKNTTTSRPIAPQDRVYPIRCTDCGEKALRPRTITHDVAKSHDGRTYSLHIPKLRLLKCDACGEIYFDKDADEQIAAALRKELSLLSPDRIRDHLDKLRLSQKQFAAKLGVAAETVTRWLTGALIQSRAMDNLMRLYFGLPEVRAALDSRPLSIPSDKPLRRAL